MLKQLAKTIALSRTMAGRVNRAAMIYAMIGGTAYNQAVAINLGWEPDCKTPGPARAAGTKIRRAAAQGVITVRHRGPFNLKGDRA